MSMAIHGALGLFFVAGVFSSLHAARTADRSRKGRTRRALRRTPPRAAAGLLAALLLLFARSALAQEAPSLEPPADPPTLGAVPAPTGKMVAVGLLLGAAGGVVGAFAGGMTVESDDFSPVAVGYLAGSAVGLSFGVYEADRRRGRFLPSALATLGIGALGGLALFETRGSGTAVIAFGVVPLLQTAAAVWIETATR